VVSLRRIRTPEVTPPPHQAPVSLVAAAARINLEGQGWRTYRFGNDEWQSEAWRLYDIIGEMRFAANWVGSACSRVRIYVADVDKNGRVQQETKDEKVAAIGDNLFGGPTQKAELLRLAGINLTVAGDFYIIGRGGKDEDDPDKWFVVSCSELKRYRGNIAYVYPDGQQDYLSSDRDLVIRVWTPHPRRGIWADSPTRAALPMLWEIERLTRYVFAQIDSRLVSAGLLTIPKEVSFPDDGDPNTPGAEGLTERLLKTGSASLRGEGTAAGVVPTIVEMPIEALGKSQLIQFTSELSRQALELRQEAVRRFALAMDMAPEILLGTGDANHWCVDEQTQILTESGWKSHAEVRVGDLVLSLNHETGLSEWTPVRDLYRARVIDEPMLSMEHKSHSSLTTRGHRWPVLRPRYVDGARYLAREFITSDRLFREHLIIAAVPSGDLPAEPKYQDDLVELLAWYWTEGHDGGNVSIAQSHTANPGNVSRIRACLSRLYGPSQSTLRASVGPAWLETVQQNVHSYGGPITVFRLNKEAGDHLRGMAPGKIVKLDVIRSLTQAQLELFIDVSCRGDGWHYPKRRDIWQRDPEALTAFEMALILSGRAVSTVQSDGGHSVGALAKDTMRPMKSVTGTHDQVIVNYTGTVWCPVTDNGTWFAKRNGTTYYTGNSAWHVGAENVKVHIEPLMTRICEAATMTYLKPALKAIKKDPDRYTFSYDTAPLVVRPQRLQDTLNLQEKGIVSNEAVLIAGDYKLTDAPTPEEDLKRFTRELMLRDPNLFQIPKLREVAGYTAAILPPDTVVTPQQTGAGPPAPPVPPTGVQETMPPPLPVASTASNALGGPGQNASTPVGARTASASVPSPVTTFVVANAAALRALEVAGKRLLDPSTRGQFPDTPPHQLHTKIAVNGVPHAQTLLRGAWDHLSVLTDNLAMTVDTNALKNVLETYCTILLAGSLEHDANMLGEALRSRGFLDADQT
jgi:hypothetical protein